mmetsp:Transcript_21492/g.55127  ORF Transcript_21492/g.55127 Transcript_21492/m.55127 type:complete len:220 (+) Transcript_21492:93-752(+)
MPGVYIAASSAASWFTSTSSFTMNISSSSSFFCSGARSLAALSTSFFALERPLSSRGVPSLSAVGIPSAPKPLYLSASAAQMGGRSAMPLNFSSSLALVLSRFCFFFFAASCCCCRRSAASWRSTAGSSGFQIAFALARSSSLMPRSTSVSSRSLSHAAISTPLSAPERQRSRTSSRNEAMASTNPAVASVAELCASVVKPMESAAPSTMPNTDRMRVT